MMNVFGVVFGADGEGTGGDPATASYTQAINKWLAGTGNDAGQIYRYKYTVNGKKQYSYAIVLPPKTDDIIIDDSGNYIYKLKNANGQYIRDVPLNIKATITFNGKKLNDATSIVLTTDNNRDMLVIPGVEYKSDGVYITFADGSVQGPISEDEFRNNIEFSYEVTAPGLTSIGSPVTKPPFKPTGGIQHKNEHWYDFIVDFVNGIVDTVKNKLSQIFSWILIKIADGIHALIDYTVGEDNVTIGSVIFGRTKKVSIDFWGIDTTSNPATLDKDQLALRNSVAGIMKPIVSFWYAKFTQIAIVCHLILLLYLGIRMMVSNKATRLEVIKERLNVWLTSVVVLIFFPFAMKYIYTINSVVVRAVENAGNSITEVDGEVSDANTTDSMTQIRNAASDKGSIPLACIYIMMLGELTVLLYNYYKRAFMVGFLITVFPIIVIKYLYEGVNSGRKRKSFEFMAKRVYGTRCYSVGSCCSVRYLN